MPPALTRNCAWCGKELIKQTQRKFCSFKCFGAFYRKPLPLCETCGKSCRYHNNRFCSPECWYIAKKKPFPPCEICGNPVKKRDRRFCSPECRYTAYRKPRRPCRICGKPCKHPHSFFCSLECFNLWNRGENVHNYVGENFRKDAYPFDYAFWQRRAKIVRERDKVCRHCGMTPEENGRALDVHHKIPFRVSQDNSPDNLIALCRKCHKKADYEYNIKQQG